MKVTISEKTGRITFSDELAKRLNLRPKNNIFLFRLKGTNIFGFMPASKEQAKAMICPIVKRSSNGELYITPKNPSAAYIAAVIRLQGDTDINVTEQPLKETKMYIFDYGAGTSE